MAGSHDGPGTKTSRELVADRGAALADLIRRKAAGEQVLTGIPTGIRALDDLLGGWAPMLAVVGAGTGVGKSSFALNLAKGPSDAGLPPPYITSAEDPLDAWADRAIAAETGIPADDLRRLNVGPEVIPRIERATAMVREWTIDDAPGLTARQAAERFWAVRDRHSVWVVDYAQALAPHRAGIVSDSREHVVEVVRTCANVARAANKPVVLLSQLKREYEERGHRMLEASKYKADPDFSGYVPRKSDLHGSSELEKVAKCVILLHRPGMWDRDLGDDIMELHVVKNNFGVAGRVLETRWDGATSTIR